MLALLVTVSVVVRGITVALARQAEQELRFAEEIAPAALVLVRAGTESCPMGPRKRGIRVEY